MSEEIRRIVVARLAHPTNRPRSSGIASRRPERLDTPPFRHCAVTLPVRIRAPWGFKRDFVFRTRGPLTEGLPNLTERRFAAFNHKKEFVLHEIILIMLPVHVIMYCIITNCWVVPVQ